jgi:predicted nucleic acid-binding protein
VSGALIADASVAISWIVGSQETALTRKALQMAIDGAEIHVPPLWYFELANSLLIATRRKLVSEADLRSGVAALTNFEIIQDSVATNHALGETFDLAQRFRLNSYDASYLELSRRSALPLATRDAALEAAARKCGVQLL